MVIPNQDSDESLSAEVPPEIQQTLDSAIQRQRNIIQSQINDFTTQKRQEFKLWQDEARKQATIIARIATPGFGFSHPSLRGTLSIPLAPKSTAQTTELFQKSPVSQYSHPSASPLAAASLSRSQSEQPLSTSPPLSKITPPPIPLSSSLKSPGSSNLPKPVKRVMFQVPQDEEAPSEAEEPQIDEIEIPSPPAVELTISVDGTAPLKMCANIDELFDFDETIPTSAAELESTPSRSSSQSSYPNQSSGSPPFGPPLSPFRRRTIEKYHLPGDEDDVFEEPSNLPKSNGVDHEDDVLSSSSSKPIAITPPSKSFLAEGLGVEEDDDEGGMKGLIERISLKNTRSGLKTSFADQRMLWDIPGDYYRSVPS